MVRVFETENPRWQNALDDKSMYKYNNEWLKPGTINRSSFGQKVHSEEMCDRFFDIIGKDSSVLGKVLARWPPRRIGSDSLAPRI
jgi:hypothetical protein